jgi:hypothetical protein
MLKAGSIENRAQSDADEGVLYRIAADLETWVERSPRSPGPLAVLASNAAAVASYRKVGFVEEARRREHCWVRGRYEDEVGMGPLRQEWQP